MRLPTLFLSHGSPMQAIAAGRAGAAWAALGRRLPRPGAVLVASAHWESDLPLLGTAARPETVHDFSGFPEALYRLRYPAPGAPELGRRAAELLDGAGLPARTAACRGLDHGAWVPLRWMYPDADLPVTQVSIQTALGAAHALRVGRALAPLAGEGVLVIGSGHLTHNLREWFAGAGGNLAPRDAEPQPYVRRFSDWVAQTLERADEAAMARYRDLAPEARRAHPSEEHFLPLPLAWAAAGERPRVERIEAGVDGGVLAMDAFLFWPDIQQSPAAA